MIHDPHRQTLCAVLSVSHPAFALLDDPDRSLRVSRWGRVIAQLAHSGTCAALQVLEATIPDPARSQSDWWETHGRNDAGVGRNSIPGALGPGAPGLLHPPHDRQPVT